MSDPVKIEVELGQASDRYGGIRATFSINSKGEAEVWVTAFESGGKKSTLFSYRPKEFARLKALVDKADQYMQKAALNEIPIPMAIDIDKA